jgi:DNA-binding HxlR family transcriptional regulator
MQSEQNDGTQFVQAILEILGGKWKLLILWHLKNLAKRYSELKRLMPEITEKMIIQQLHELERDGELSFKMEILSRIFLS